jgi:hypothetical protein
MAEPRPDGHPETDDPRGDRNGAQVAGAAGIASGVVGAILLIAGLATFVGPPRPALDAPALAPATRRSEEPATVTAPGPILTEAAAVPTEPAPVPTEPVPVPTEPVPVVAGVSPAQLAALTTNLEPLIWFPPADEPVPTPRGEPTPRNAIRNFRALSLSGSEMEVTVDYQYTGTHGSKDVFLHAAALQDHQWSSRVPGTGFPDARIKVGSGTVTISITKAADTGNATSTRVRACMVSIPTRAAFACETFAFSKDWK